MTFKDVYQDTPFHDPNWILVRYKKNKRHFWTYEYEGQMRINIKLIRSGAISGGRHMQR